MEGKQMKVPSELSHSFFFPDGYFLWLERDSHHFRADQPLIYDASYYLGMSSLRPWEEPEKYHHFLLLEFDQVKVALAPIFKQRDTANTRELMRRLLGLFLEFLFWSNRLPVSFPLDKIEKLTNKPINMEERLQFVLSRPTMYHSYIQLIELMGEHEKLISKAKLMNRLKTTKSVRK